MSKFLWACEDILTAKRMDPTWPKAVKVIMREHADYFMSNEFLSEKEFYYTPVQVIIDEVVAEYLKEKPNA